MSRTSDKINLQINAKKEFQKLITITPIDYKTLHTLLHNTSSFEKQIEFIRLKMMLRVDEILQRYQLAQKIADDINRSPKFQLKHINILGSSQHRLGFKDAELDLNVDCENVTDPVDEKNLTTPTLADIRYVLLSNPLYESVTIPDDYAYIPIVKLTWPGQPNSITCNISLNASYTLTHAQVIVHFSIYEPLFADLVMLTLTWMRNSNMIHKNRLNTLSAISLVMFYMQKEQLLPPVYTLQKKPSTLRNLCYELAVSDEWKSPVTTKPSIGELFMKFFIFYGDFDFSKVVSTNRGDEVVRGFFFQDKHFLNSYVVIQDLFDFRNSTTRKMSNDFTVELLHTFRSLSTVAIQLRLDHEKQAQLKPMDMFLHLIDNNVIVSKERHYKPYLTSTVFQINCNK